MSEAPTGASLDPVSRLILDEAGDLGDIVLVIDDRHGVLASAAASRGSTVLAACDDIRDEHELPESVTVVDLTADPDLRAVKTVLWRLPRAVSAVQDTAELLAVRCAPEVHVFGGARDKDLTLAMNGALLASFRDVSASWGKNKARVLRAAGPQTAVRTWPRTTTIPELGLTLTGFGGVFAAGRLDAGTRLLLRALRNERAMSGRALDLGCGTGIVGATLASIGWDVVAADVSAAAVASTRLTMIANQVEAPVLRAEGIPACLHGLDLVACNPPFHRRAAKDSSAGFDLIADAGRAVRRGGELWLVFNSHLPYLPVAADHVGPTRVLVRDRSYIVTVSTRR